MKAVRTIAIFYVTVGYGHRRAAFALRAALKRLNPEVRVICLDIFELWPAWIGRALVNGYRGFIRLLPGVWGYVYDHRGIKRRFSRILVSIYRLCRKRIGMLLEELEPAAAVSTQAFPAGLLSVYKKECNPTVLLVAVPTDFTVHSYWIDETVDRYLLPCEESREKVIARGVPPARTRVTGIPVDSKFDRTRQGDLIKSKYGLAPDLPVVLLMGGGEGTIRLEQLIRALDQRREQFQMAALSGRNLKEYARLKKLLPELRHPLKIFGFIDRVEELMEAGEVIVTKPGGLTVAEVLVRKRPLVLVDPLPGQEELNARFLVEKGAALRAGDNRRASEAVGRLLGDSVLREHLIESMGEIARPRSAEAAARCIMELVERSDD